jgi:hypothetical protein
MLIGCDGRLQHRSVNPTKKIIGGIDGREAAHLLMIGLSDGL